MEQLYIKNSTKWNSLVGKIGTSHIYFHSYYFPIEKYTWLCLLVADVVCVYMSDVRSLNTTLCMALTVISRELFDWNFYCFVLTIVKILTWNHANCPDYSWVLLVNMFYNTHLFIQKSFVFISSLVSAKNFLAHLPARWAKYSVHSSLPLVSVALYYLGMFLNSTTVHIQ